MAGALTFDPGTVDLDALLKRLHLANARRVWHELCERAETEQWACRDFLAVLVAEEIAHRQQTRLRRAVHDAHFPFLKTIEDFNFSFQSTVRFHLLGSYLGPEFRHRGAQSDPHGNRPGRPRINSTRFRSFGAAWRPRLPSLDGGMATSRDRDGRGNVPDPVELTR